MRMSARPGSLASTRRWPNWEGAGRRNAGSVASSGGLTHTSSPPRLRHAACDVKPEQSKTGHRPAAAAGAWVVVVGRGGRGEGSGAAIEQGRADRHARRVGLQKKAVIGYFIVEGLQGAHQLLDVANEKDPLRPGAPLGFDDEWKGD